MAIPSQTDIQDAKDFLVSRLNAEQSASHNLEIELIIFANMLLKLYRKYNCTPDSVQAKSNTMLQMEIQLLVRKFKDTLYHDLELLCINADPERRNDIILLMNTPIQGVTLRSRFDHWTALTLAYITDQIIRGVNSFRHIPTSIDGMYGLNRLMQQTIANVYMDEWKHQHPNAQGFYSYRGSSYPCSYCDDMTGYHPIKDYPAYGNWHVNCKCYFVFI